jgi:hypothetical protein
MQFTQAGNTKRTRTEGVPIQQLKAYFPFRVRPNASPTTLKQLIVFYRDTRTLIFGKKAYSERAPWNHCTCHAALVAALMPEKACILSRRINQGVNS